MELIQVVRKKIRGEKRRQGIEKNALSHGDTLTCSFGVSMFKGNDLADNIIERVDDRLYQAKNSGRNQVCVKM